jgi:2-polyprenyl-3-methyl-5-hydroxy-6-metoxy-1,4-benzoquinol methylase
MFGSRSKNETSAAAPVPFDLCHATLDAFVEQVDRDGGPHLIDRTPKWQGMTYRPSLQVNQALDPFSEAYTDQQIALYKEISTRGIDPYVNELADFDMEWHANSANPMAVGPSDLVPNYARLSKLAGLARLPNSARVLDMGCGWGLSSEFFATLGCVVTAVDINPGFIELINRRSQRLKNGIKTIHGSFEDVELTGKYDVIVFHICLHHAIRPWEVISRLSRHLNPNGCIAIAGEPIQSTWWKHWGLRFDPLSIYCIRKYGWFESGWSQPFITQAFERSGLRVEMTDDPNPEIGMVAIARRDVELARQVTPSEIRPLQTQSEWHFDGDYLISTGDSVLKLSVPDAFPHLRFNAGNFKGKDIALKILDEQGMAVYDGILKPGDNVIDLDYGGPRAYRFVADAWSPLTEFGQADGRQMTFHLTKIEFWSDKRPR